MVIKIFPRITRSRSKPQKASLQPVATILFLKVSLNQAHKIAFNHQELRKPPTMKYKEQRDRPSEERYETAGRIRGHFLFARGSSPIRAPALALLLHELAEVRNDRVARPHLGSDTSRRKEKRGKNASVLRGIPIVWT